MDTRDITVPCSMETNVLKSEHFLENLKLFACTRSDYEAFVFLSTDKYREAITWGDLYQKSQDVAYALVDIGVQRGDIVAVSMRTCPEWLFIALGSMLMGAVPINLVFTLKDGSDVLALMKKLEKCSFLALDPGSNDGNWEIFKKLIDVVSADGTVSSSKMPYLRYLIGHHPDKTIPGVKMFRDWMKESHPKCELPPINPGSMAFLFQTSGSMGVPKVVPHSYFSLECVHNMEKCGVNFDRTIYNDRPFGWFGGFPFNFMYGNTRITLSGFCEPPKDKVGFLIEAVRKEKILIMLMLPSAIAELVSRQDELSENSGTLQTILTGGQPITSNVMQAIGVVCQEIVVTYAATEFTGISCLPVNDPNDYEDMCCGVPVSEIEIKIVDKEGIEVPVNMKGEIYIRSKWGFEGYLNDREKSMRSVTEDGWFKTGDLGKVNDRAELFVMGRIGNEIIRGGMNISPEIIEAVLKECPFVENAIVVPIPDESLFQELCACVTLKKGVKATEHEIRKHCEDVYADPERMFSYLPAYYLIFENFPQTHSGKDSRIVLSEKSVQIINDQKRL